MGFRKLVKLMQTVDTSLQRFERLYESLFSFFDSLKECLLCMKRKLRNGMIWTFYKRQSKNQANENKESKVFFMAKTCMWFSNYKFWIEEEEKQI